MWPSCAASLLLHSAIGYTHSHLRQERTQNTPNETGPVPAHPNWLAKAEPENTLWMLTKHPDVWHPAELKTQKSSSRGIWADQGSEAVISHHSKSEEKPQSSQHQRPAELPWVIKYNVRCFKVFSNTLLNDLLCYLDFFFLYPFTLKSMALCTLLYSLINDGLTLIISVK